MAKLKKKKSVEYIPREQNTTIDVLSKLASTGNKWGIKSII